nr:ubiquitin domain-containing protein 1-like [Salvelinus alpinus]
MEKEKDGWESTLTESYDELGNRYQLPAYTLTPPANLITERANDNEAPNQKEQKKPPAFPKEEFQLRVRLSCGKDLRISASMSDSISQLKTVLEGQEDIEVAHQRWFFAGKLLTDKIRLQDTKIQKDFVVQVIVNNYSPVTKLMPN